MRLRQEGIALIAMMAVLTLGASWWLVTALNTPANRAAIHRAHNAKVLQEAKQALLAHAAAMAIDSSEKYPGRLPCAEGLEYIGAPAAQGIAAPGVQGGINAPNCPAIGRLPWRSLGLDQLRDAYGEPLWYMVSTGWAYQNTATVLSINSNTQGALSVDGSPVVAVIIAPGPQIVLAPTAAQVAAGCAARSQVRTPAAPNHLDYVECQNVAGSTLRTSVPENAANPVFNDQFVTVTAAEVMAAIEPAVAVRIQKQVVPLLQSVYATATWGASAAAPVFPYAATFMDPAASDFKGTVGTPQGLLPLTAGTCNALTAGRCDANFVSWDTATVSAVQTGGTATSFSANCTASTSTQIQCTVTYSRLLCLLCGISAQVEVRGDGRNVGRTLKELDGTPASGLTTLTATLQAGAAAAARVTYAGTLQGGSFGLCGSLIGLLCTGTATIRIPIAVFQDHPLVNPVATDAWYWFIWNRWHDVTYYAVAASHTPNGATHDCTSAADCLSIAGGNPGANVQATLALAGRSLSGTAGSNRALADFLDSAENQNLDAAFEQSKVNRTFNDRFVAVGNY